MPWAKTLNRMIDKTPSTWSWKFDKDLKPWVTPRNFADIAKTGPTKEEVEEIMAILKEGGQCEEVECDAEITREADEDDRREADIIKRQLEITKEWWGERCDVYEPACPCCKAWVRTDLLIDLIDDQYLARQA